jgi:hypothetical protein
MNNKRYIYLNDENIVTGFISTFAHIEGTVESELGKIGQHMLEDGTFEDVVLPLWEQQYRKYPVQYQMVLDEKSFTAEQFLEYTGEVFILESE